MMIPNNLLGPFNCIVADPPYSFSDKLIMSNVKRGGDANYNGTLSIDEICSLPVKDISADDALLALWVPGSMISDGIKIMDAWGFAQKQTWIWVKIKKTPFKNFEKDFKKIIDPKIIIDKLNSFDLNQTLAFGMGRYFRQCHELALIGTRGKMTDKILNKSQRSVHFEFVEGHSKKPEGLQNKLDLMVQGGKKIELFARRDRPGYLCLGNECPSSFGQDIRFSLKKLLNNGTSENSAA